mmetsp:Transcript_23425/g.25996  ORF Transcript_23425/g.25996 Transcript_23425/m.25996 type:complete len:218 (+) Transcript_23425:278-931(+)
MTLSLFWVQDIFDEAYNISNKSTFFDTIANMLFRKGIMIIYLAQVMLISYLPFYLGDILSLVFLSWLYSYYCFEYKIFALNLNTMESIQVFESNWAYYLGFGLPFTSLLYMYPGLINSGIFALAFPFLVLVSVEAAPPSNEKLLEKLKEKVKQNQLKKSLTVFQGDIKQEFSDTYLLRKMLKQSDTGLVPSRIKMFYIPKKIYSFFISKLQKFTIID